MTKQRAISLFLIIGLITFSILSSGCAPTTGITTTNIPSPQIPPKQALLVEQLMDQKAWEKATHVLANYQATKRGKRLLAECFWQMGMEAKGKNHINFYVAAVQADPTFLPARRKLALTFLLNKQPKAAIPHFEFIIQENATALDFYYYGTLFYDMKKYRKASIIIQQGMKKFPKSEKLDLAIKTIVKKFPQKVFPITIMAAWLLLEKDSTHFHANHLIAKEYYDLGNYQAALVAIDKCIKSQPKSASAQSLKGWVLYALNKKAEAKKAFSLARMYERAKKGKELLSAIEGQLRIASDNFSQAMHIANTAKEAKVRAEAMNLANLANSEKRKLEKLIKNLKLD